MQIFLNEMKKLLKSEYNDFIKTYNDESFKGLRLNPIKCNQKTLFDEFGELEKTPFSQYGYYYNDEKIVNGKNPLHHGGAYYIQEPSATSAVTMLDVQKNDKVLDLCAAPGGKSTQIGGYLMGSGLLWSNEIVRGRANILASNIERMGIRNSIVSSIYPEILCNALAGYFDKVLVDAPCSGEGMFRKDKDAFKEWSLEQVKVCANRQLQILNSAKNALKPGGTLVYSTCTFSYEENELVIDKFLKDNPCFSVVDSNENFGRGGYEPIPLSRRIFPMDGGEGHFAVKLIKNDGVTTDTVYKENRIDKTILSQTEQLYDTIIKDRTFGQRYALFGNKLVLLPQVMPDISGLGVIKAGVILGELKKNRIEPHHNIFTCSTTPDLVNSVSLNKEEAMKYLHGEEIPTDSKLKGYTGILYRDISLGYGKVVNGKIKNKYPKGLRNI